MNKQRRKQLEDIYFTLDKLMDQISDVDFASDDGWTFHFDVLHALEDLRILTGFEEESFYNRSEGSQQSASGQESEMAIDSMNEASDCLEEFLDALYKVQQSRRPKTIEKYLNEATEIFQQALDALSDISF